MARIYQRVWRTILWLSLIIIVLNIENVATALGIANILAENASLWQRMMSALFNIIRSNTAFHLALFLAGGGVFAWGMFLLKRLEEYDTKPSLYWTAAECETTAKYFRDYSVAKWFGTSSKIIGRANRRLERLGLRPVSVSDINDKDERIRLAGYFFSLAAHLQLKDLEGAKLVSATLCDRRLSLGTPAPVTEQSAPQKT